MKGRPQFFLDKHYQYSISTCKINQMLAVKTLPVGDLAANCYLVSSSITPGTVAGTPDSSQVRSQNECLILDPGDDADFITETIGSEKLKPTAIVLTHGHFDHVLGCLELKLNFDVPILLHEKDKKIYTSANQSAAHWLNPEGALSGKNFLKVPPIDQFIKEGDKIKVGGETLTVIETPGHTPGSICLYYSPTHNVIPVNLSSSRESPPLEGTRGSIGIDSHFRGNDNTIRSAMRESVLFTGDTLFKDAVGRTNLSYSSPSDLAKSLTKLKSLLKLKTVSYQLSTVVYPGHGESFTLSESSASIY